MASVKRPVKAVLLLGPTGAGKSPLGDCLEKKGFNGRRFLHFDFGEQLRAVASSALPPEGFEAREHSFIRDVLEKGLLLEKEHFPIALKVVDSFLRRNHFGPADTLVLNGLPRHVGQAQDMDAVAAVRSVVVLECSPGDTHQRICTNVGGDRTARTDDDTEMVRKKLEIYRKRTAPLIDYYTDKKCTVMKIEVTPESTVEAVYSTLVSAGYSL
jgi:adenylate kinase